MQGFIQRDEKNNILSISADQSSVEDIIIDENLFLGFMDGVELLSNWKIVDNQLIRKEFYLTTAKDFKTLSFSDDYPLDEDALLIVPDVKKGFIHFYLPPNFVNNYYEESFAFIVDNEIIDVALMQFDNGYFFISYVLKADSIYQIQNSLSSVYLIHRLKNINTNKRDILAALAKVDRAEVIPVPIRQGMLAIPSYLCEKTAYYVNAEDRNELLDTVKATRLMPYRKNTVILIDGHEIKPK